MKYLVLNSTKCMEENTTLGSIIINLIKQVQFAHKFNLSCTGAWRSQFEILDAETEKFWAK